mmetsp:Transcript_10641/g.20589  ORF Transcript_10641/g.20589 Transcript_10641/m.20589 type:complete len:124 (+) Transcript_10641:2453-2824(+)
MAEVAPNPKPFHFELEKREPRGSSSSVRDFPSYEISPVYSESDSDSVAPVGTIFTAACLVFLSVMMIILGVVKNLKNEGTILGAIFWFIGFVVLIPGVILGLKAIRIVRQNMSERANILSVQT